MLHQTNFSTYAPVTPSISEILEDTEAYRPKPSRQRKHPETTLLKRIPLNRLMDLKVDFAFKQLFGNEKNKAITVVFLNSFLQKANHEPITDITFDNTEENAAYEGDKESRLDILAVTKGGKRINIEIQFTNQYNMVNRSIYYWSGLYRRQMKRGKGYEELKPVIAINIMNFNYIKQTERFHTTYHLYEDKEKFQITDVMEFHFVEMPKLIKAWKNGELDPWNDILARWLLFLGVVDRKNDKVYEEMYKELEEIAMRDETLKTAFESWQELSMDEKQYAAYEGRMKRILDEEAAIREAELRMQKVERAMERVRAEAEKTKTEAEKTKAEAEKTKLEAEKTKAEAEKTKAEAEKTKAEAEKTKTEAEKARAEAEKARAEAEEAVKKAEKAKAWGEEKTARRLLMSGFSVEDVEKFTGLDKVRIKELKREL